MPAKLISLAVAAERTDVSVKTLRRHIAAGKLRAYRVGRLIKIDPDDLTTLLVKVPTA